LTTAFLTLGRQAAKSLKVEDLPLTITPHPLNDLTLEEVRELADAAYPVILDQLTSQSTLPRDAFVEFVRPAGREKGGASLQRA
jgi:hypothetical protein